VRFGDYQDQILRNSFSQMRLVTGLLSMSLVMVVLLSLTPQLVQPGFLTDRVLFAVPFDVLVSVLFAVHDFAVLFAVHVFAVLFYVHDFAVLFAVHDFAVLYAVFVAVLFSVHDFAVLFAVHYVVVHVFGVVFLMALLFLELCLAN